MMRNVITVGCVLARTKNGKSVCDSKGACKHTPYETAILALGIWLLLLTTAFAQQPSTKHDPLPNTAALTMEGDLAEQMVAGCDRFLLKEWDRTAVERRKYWNELVADEQRVKKEFPELRKTLAKMLGAHEERPAPQPLTDRPMHHLASSDRLHVYAFSWPVMRDVHVEGLMLRPTDEWLKELDARKLGQLGTAIVIPDSSQLPEEMIGLVGKVPLKNQLPRHLAEHGHLVFVPYILDRNLSSRNRRAIVSNREFAYRTAFELGRHPIGYELQKIVSLVDLAATHRLKSLGSHSLCVAGYGEGGMLALLAAAIETRIDVAGVSGYFASRDQMWNEPLDRNVFGLWNRFGNNELALLASDHAKLFIETCEGPEVRLTGEGGGAPGFIKILKSEINLEIGDLREYQTKCHPRLMTLRANSISTDAENYWSSELRFALMRLPESERGLLEPDPAPYVPPRKRTTPNQPLAVEPLDKTFERTWFANDYVAISEKRVTEYFAPRAQRQLDQIINDTQRLLADSPYVRQEFMKKLDTSSLEKYEKSVEPYREYFAKEVIGQFDQPLLPPQPRSRQVYDEEKWTGYEVVLDVFPDVFAYGLLLLPKDIKEGEQRPVVVCQHGLEGRPQDVIGDQKRNAYEAFAAKLAERGFITFAPQNIYIGKDKFRTLQRKANPLGKTLFSIMVPQHQQIVNWLGSLPMVDKSRIAFYGLSYGGKSAMRIPPLVKEYSAVICSADFNEWVWKNASVKSPVSYVWTGEYEIFEWDLGSTFNYAEMAALICPRPFMVERGHFDGVSTDEAVAYEFAKVRFLYEAKLKLPGRCEMEVFDGPHKINGKGTFDFLHKHLRWPKPAG